MRTPHLAGDGEHVTLTYTATCAGLNPGTPSHQPCDWTTTGDPATVDRASDKHVKTERHCVVSGTGGAHWQPDHFLPWEEA